MVTLSLVIPVWRHADGSAVRPSPLVFFTDPGAIRKILTGEPDRNAFRMYLCTSGRTSRSTATEFRHHAYEESKPMEASQRDGSFDIMTH